jgi:hypothetical protein
MRHLGVIIATLALTAGGCVLPCGNGACNSTESLYEAPSPRFFGTSKRCSQTPVCKPKPYVTFAKYWPVMDDLHTTWTAKKCAKRILLRQEWSSKRIFSGDYKDGFKQAFIDIAQGSNGEVPAVPPPKFWNTHFRSNWGQRKAELWFNGYRAGVAIASVEMHDLRYIAASADWTVEKPSSPFASQASWETGGCLTGESNSRSLLNPEPMIPFRGSFGNGQLCQTCPTPNLPPRPHFLPGNGVGTNLAPIPYPPPLGPTYTPQIRPPSNAPPAPIPQQVIPVRPSHSDGRSNPNSEKNRPARPNNQSTRNQSTGDIQPSVSPAGFQPGHSRP